MLQDHTKLATAPRIFVEVPGSYFGVTETETATDVSLEILVCSLKLQLQEHYEEFQKYP